jgi:hypothetical protein
METLTTALPTTATLIAPSPLTEATPGQSTSSSNSFASSSATNADGQTTGTSSSLITSTSSDGIFNQTRTVTTNGITTTITSDDSPLMMPQSFAGIPGLFGGGLPMTVNLVVTGLPTIDVLAMAQAMDTTLLLVGSTI